MLKVRKLNLLQRRGTDSCLRLRPGFPGIVASQQQRKESGIHGMEISREEQTRPIDLHCRQLQKHRAGIVFRAGETEEFDVLGRADLLDLLRRLRPKQQRENNECGERPHGALL